MSSPLFDVQQIAGFELRNTLGRYLSTGSPIVDMIVGIFLFRIALYLTSLAETYFSWINFQSFWSRIFRRRSRGLRLGEIEFEWNTHPSDVSRSMSGCDLPEGYKAVAFKLSNFPDNRVNRLRETFLSLYDRIHHVYNEESVFECIQKEPVEVLPGVYSKVVETEIVERCSTGKQNSYVSRKVFLYSDIYRVHALKQMVESWKEEYKLFKLKELAAKQFIFQVRFDKLGNEEIFHVPFYTFRNFDNLHFHNKESVLKELNFFINGVGWYEERGLPHSLGILLHGPPGCGKTSFIKALMSATLRHAVVFFINEFSDLKVIEKLMRSETINGFPIPQESRIYILEDIDAMGDIVKERKFNSYDALGDMMKEGKFNSLPSATVAALKRSTSPSKSKKKTPDGEGSKNIMKMLLTGLSAADKNQNNHLGFMLNLLDGVIEMPGRILVMTTNFISKLDQALIRPGRIDLKLEFTYCTRDVIQFILGQFFDVEVKAIHLPSNVADGVLSPAKIVQTCRANKMSLERTLLALEAECVTILAERKK